MTRGMDILRHVRIGLQVVERLLDLMLHLEPGVCASLATAPQRNKGSVALSAIGVGALP